MILISADCLIWNYTPLFVHKLIKGIVWQKKMLKCTRAQVIQDVGEMVSPSEQIWKNVVLHHLLTKGSSVVNGCRQSESPNISNIFTITHK